MTAKSRASATPYEPGWRNCQKAMMSGAAKVTAPDPASNPSNPSVKLTALVVGQNPTAKTIQTTGPRSTPVPQRVREMDVQGPDAR